MEGVDVAKGRAIVLTSNLGGNSWDSSVKIVDVGTTEAIVSLSRPCSSADISWVGSGGERAVCAEDSGDLKVQKSFAYGKVSLNRISFAKGTFALPSISSGLSVCLGLEFGFGLGSI